MRILISFIVLLFSQLAIAQSVPPPALAANAWLLLDHGTGQALVSHKPDERVEPASLTKLMTAYVVFGALKNGSITLEQQVNVSEAAWKQVGSRMFIQPRLPVTVDELIHGMIIQSGNDACVALAELVAGSEESFVHLMNREAERLGMKNTHFTNASGLPDPQLYTTARDLAILASALIREYPEFYRIYSKREYTYNKITQPNRNRLLYMDNTVDGMKTGHTSTAGYCLVSSAERGSRRLISVLLGAETDTIRAQESLKLLNHGFQFFDTVKLYDGGQALSQVRVWKGQQNELAAGFLEDFVLSLPKGEGDKLDVEMISVQPVVAPIQKGQTIGTIKIRSQGREIGEYPVVALADVELAGFFGRLWDALVMWIKSL